MEFYSEVALNVTISINLLSTFLLLEARGVRIRGLLEKYPTFGREKETGLLGALDT